MKSLKQFLLNEDEAVIKTSEVVNTLRAAGENTAEIKKDIDTTKPKQSYTDFIKMYATKLLEWFKIFSKIYKIVINDERKGFGETLGIENIRKMEQLVLNINQDSSNLLKLLDTKVDESFNIFAVKNIKNYEILENKFTALLEFEERITKFENAHFSELKKEYPDILKQREILATHMKSVEKCRNMFLNLIDTIRKYKNTRL